MEKNMQQREGWSWDITTNHKRHYYKNGVSLCGKAIEKHYMNHFDKDSPGSKYFKDCTICIKKLNHSKPI